HLAVEPYAATPDLHSFPTRRSSDLRPVDRGPDGRGAPGPGGDLYGAGHRPAAGGRPAANGRADRHARPLTRRGPGAEADPGRSADRKSTRLNSSHVKISYAVFCLKK